MKMIGIPQPEAARWLWSCSPFMPGICTSTMRQDVSFSGPDLRKLSADSKAAARKPKDSMSSVVVLRTDSSSSTTEIRFFVTLNSPLNKVFPERERIYWALVDLGHKKDDSGKLSLTRLFPKQALCASRSFLPCRQGIARASSPLPGC